MTLFFGITLRLVTTIIVAFTAVVWFDLAVALVDSGQAARGWATVFFTSLYVFYVYWILWAKWYYDYLDEQHAE